MRRSKLLRIKLAARRSRRGADELVRRPPRCERTLQMSSDLVKVTLKGAESRGR